MKFKMTKKKWILLAVVAVVAIGVGSCYNKASKLKPTLSAVTLGDGNLRSYLSTSGKVTQGKLDEYILSGSSEVKAVHFEVGDTVKAGDLIVEFDNTQAMEDYKKAAIDYEKNRLNLDDTERKYFDLKEKLADAKDDVDWYKKKYDEYEDVVDQQDVARRDAYENSWEAAKKKVESLEDSIMSDEQIKIAQLNFEQSKMTMDQAQKTIDELPKNIVAKHDGVIETLSAVQFNHATKGQTAVTVRTTGATTIDVNIGRYDLGKVALGQKVDITVSNKKYTGTVSEINPIANADSYVKATVSVDNPDGLIPGVDADLDILTYSADNVLVAPIEAIKTDRQGDYCYLLTPVENAEKDAPPQYTVAKTYVKTGNSSDTDIQILDGVSQGAQVVVNPPKNIDAIPVCQIIDITGSLD